jgi:hypothetical protein
MANVSLSEYCRHLSSIFRWQPKFDGHCTIVNRNICYLAIAPKLLSLVLMCLDIFLVLPKLDSGLEMCLLVATQGTRSHLLRMNSFDGGADSQLEGGASSQFIASRHAYSFQHHGYIFNW